MSNIKTRETIADKQETLRDGMTFVDISDITFEAVPLNFLFFTKHMFNRRASGEKKYSSKSKRIY
jgi:hypothetical protein